MNHKPLMTDVTRPVSLGLFTDLYELTMLQAYYAIGMHEEAVFSLFVRRLPPQRNYLLACGQQTLLDCLANLAFEDDDIAYLESLGKFSDDFLQWLRNFRFTGDVHALPEGTPVFANEPIVEVVAPMPQAQLIETLVMNQIHVQTVLASKAVRIVTAAQGRDIIDFGARRMHGFDAAMKAARAFHIGGVAATSNVLAGKVYGIPVAGTMAHSYIQAHEDEMSAFRDFVRLYPDTILLVDTYDTLEGISKVIDLAQEIGDDFKVRAIRLDSGDLAQLARDARRMLDDAGLNSVHIFASGGLDEHEIVHMIDAGAPIDSFGVGTRMGVASDAPDLDIAYKLCEYAGEGRLKLSPGKPIIPGRKQVFRAIENGEANRDIIARADESLQGEPLLQHVMRNGTIMDSGRISLDDMRDHAAREIARLPQAIRAIEPADPPYPVEVSDTLQHYHADVTKLSAGTRPKQS